MAGMVAMDEPRGTSHTASASTDTSVWAHLAHHFEVARDAAEPVPSLGVNVPMRQVVQVDTIVRLRRYNTAIEPVWNNGYSVYTLYNEDDGPLPDEPPEGGMARLFGMPGVGKTEWLHFMAIPFLKQLEDDGAGVMVFDHATGYERRAVLVPQNLRGRYKGGDGSLHVQVATTEGQQSVEFAAAMAKRVFHLLDGSSGCFWGTVLGTKFHEPDEYFHRGLVVSPYGLGEVCYRVSEGADGSRWTGSTNSRAAQRAG